MSERTSSRNAAVLAALAVAACALVASAVFAWKQFGGFRRDLRTLAARPESDRTVESIAGQVRELGARRAELQARTAEMAGRARELRKRLMPMEPDASRKLKLEVLDLAARCGLVVEEVKPMLMGGRNLDPEWACPVATAPGNGPGSIAGSEAGSIAFLKKLPAGEDYRRPLVELECTAEYEAVRRFFAELGGLSWNVTPVSFGLARTGEAAPAPAADAGDEAYGASAPARWVRDDGRLRVSVVLAL